MYWDSSAIVPLIVAEARTARVRAWLKEDPGIITWAWTRVEVSGAIERRFRAGSITRAQRTQALDRLGIIAGIWDEVSDILVVRARAIPLLARHPLRAADAGQLGAALAVSDSPESRMPFVCLDEALAAAAEREGLRVLAR